MSSTISAHVYAAKSLALFVVCAGLIAYETPSFANDNPQTATLSPSSNEETPEWRRRIKSQDVESVESAEKLAVGFNSARLAAGLRGAGEADDSKGVLSDSARVIARN